MEDTVHLTKTTCLLLPHTHTHGFHILNTFRRQTLFPQHVKDRLLDDKAEEAKAEEANARRKKQQANMNAFRNNGNMEQSLSAFFNADDDIGNDDKEILTSKPIADLFPAGELSIISSLF